MYIKPKIDIEWIENRQPNDYNYPHAPFIPSRKEKTKETRQRRKHYKFLDETRIKIMMEHFPSHIDHNMNATDTHYDNSIFQREFIYCECGKVLEITQSMFEKEHGKEYKLNA